MTTTALDLINGAFSKARVRAVGQTMSADDSAHGLTILNNMLEEWALEDLMLYEEKEEDFPMISGQASYSIGESGSPDFDTVRPETILPWVFVRDGSNYDHPVEVIPLKQYRGLYIKGNSGRPYYLAYNPTYPNGTIYLYYTPNSTESIYFRSLKQVSSFASLTTEVTLPPGYKSGIISNLAVYLSPDYGKTISPELAALAMGAKKKIKARNVRRVDPVSLEVAGLSGRRSDNIYNLWL